MIFILRFVLLWYTLVTDMHFDDMDLEVIAFYIFYQFHQIHSI